ncbi:ABC transporter ATP-binding protein [Candidatus Poribacteria bacterium]
MVDENILVFQNLKKYFPMRAGVFGRVREHIRAVDDVSAELRKGETLGIVGETGCGKSTLGRTVIRLYQPTSGRILLSDDDGQLVDITHLSGSELLQFRKDMQIIFQDPFSSLNPRMTVQAAVEEGLIVNKIAIRRERRDMVAEILERVGIPADYMNRYPHEFSGGQRQRIGIARALILKPKLIVCDEPVSALDVSIQSQILNLLVDLREEFGISYLFISHDLSVVRYISDRVAVMYLGELMEMAESDELYGNPLHPYTQALLSAIPTFDTETRKKRINLTGEPPSPINPPSGCRFHPRCPIYIDGLCDEETPSTFSVDNGHEVRCHAVERDFSGGESSKL